MPYLPCFLYFFALLHDKQSMYLNLPWEVLADHPMQTMCYCSGTTVTLHGHFVKMVCRSGLAKRYLLGLGAESLLVEASLPFAKMILSLGDDLGKRITCYNKLFSTAPKIPFCQA